MAKVAKDATQKMRELMGTSKRLTESLMDMLRQDQPALNKFILLLALLEENHPDRWVFSMMTGEALEVAYSETFHAGESRDAFIRELRSLEMKGGIH